MSKMIRQSPRLQEKKSQAAMNISANSAVPKPDNMTCLAYDERCMLHKCLDGRDHPERPERIKRIFDKLVEDGLVDRCIKLESRSATMEEILLIHDERYIKELSEIEQMEIDDLRLWQEKWNSIYACHDTWKASLLSCGNLLQCVDTVLSGRALNGAAVIRPPGHHAESDTAYGFCFINNVAVAAQYARKMLGVGKVLILDWDVHHGNGVQTAFYNDPTVLYISLHRYDNGRFFPQNELNNYMDIGEGEGRGFNINVPWNGRSMGDAEYMKAFEQIVMPVAREFNPDLILVSAGFDAARGDPLGGYRVSPSGYAHMTSQLCSLANGRVILALEGGYNLTSISESMAACVRVLLGEDPIDADEEVKPCAENGLKTIKNVLGVLKDHWKCLLKVDIVETKDEQVKTTLAAADATIQAIEALTSNLKEQLHIEQKKPVRPPPATTSSPIVSITGLVHDEDISIKHYCIWDQNHIECPARLSNSLQKIRERGLLERCLRLEAARADVSEICRYHDMNIIEKLSETSNWDEQQLESLSSKFDDVFLTQHTYEAALTSAGSTINAVKAILDGRCTNSMALVRPPGHHAMCDTLNGFCVFNNVVIATKMALENYKLKRILIVDWDVHHGQGTQRPFYNDPRVLYFSIHRYEHGTFWPNLRESNWDYTGGGPAKGFNVNVPLNKIGLGDAEYLAIFTNILLPLANEFMPELVIISAGYDAAVGCPEGQMNVSPLCYGHLTHMLMGTANGRVCVVLEGGYCLDSLAEGVAMSLRALLGDYCPKLPSSLIKPIDSSVIEVLLNLAHELKGHWACMDALCTAVHTVMLKLERPQYTPSKTLYKWTPIDKTIYVTKDKYVARPDDVVEHYRNVVEKMMSGCRLDKLQYKLAVGGEGHLQAIKKLQEDDLDKKVICWFDAERRDIAKDFDFVHGNGSYEQHEAKISNSNESQSTNKTQDHLHFGLFLNALESIYASKTQSAVVFLKDIPQVNAIADIILYAQKKFGGDKKILVVDFCDQFQDNISRRFYEEDSILSICLHRYVWGLFGQPENIGQGRGAGFNANLIWNSKNVSDAEYLFALHHIILPMAYSFAPSLVIIISDFVSGKQNADSRFSPAFYAYFVYQLQALAEGKLILITQDSDHGDTSVSPSYACARTLLLGSIMPELTLHLDKGVVSPGAVSSFVETVFHLRPYWPYMQCVLAPNPNVGGHVVVAEIVQPTGNALEELVRLPDQFSYVGQMYGIAAPSLNCPHVTQQDVIGPVPDANLVNTEIPCDRCDNIGENWICLTCWNVHCSRYINEHANIHSKVTGHPIALSLADLSVWCYLCDTYIQNDLLMPAKRVCYLAKFGVDMPTCA